MEIILRESIKSLGKAGDVIKVADGYARNYLIPKQLAIHADKKNLKLLEGQRKRILTRAATLKNEFDALASKLGEIKLEIQMLVGEEGKLFGSVTTMDIEKAIAEKGYEIDRKKIELSEPIKTIGDYVIDIRLHSDVTAKVFLSVVPKNA
jgi:large subunit ribosomal protein L9